MIEKNISSFFNPIEVGEHLINSFFSRHLVLSDIQSSASSSPRNSSISSHITTMNNRSRRGSNTGRQSLLSDTNENKPIEPRTPVKVLVFNGKCSEIFKSTIEECVEDCVLEFSGQPAIYISKAGQATQRPLGNRQNLNQSARTQRRRSSVTQFNLPQLGGARVSQTNNISISTAALTATTASRMRQQINQQKFSLADNITEESTDHLSSLQDPTVTEFDSEQQQNTSQEEITSNSEVSPQSCPPAHRKLPSAPLYSSYRQRQKDFRLSDLVMRGPEYYAHIFNLPRTSHYNTRATTSRQRSSTAQHRQNLEDQYNEFDRIKQDLFHRYLWTQKPQVSCRIRPISTYTRSTTFVL